MVPTGRWCTAKTSANTLDGRHAHEEPEDILSAFLGVVYDYIPVTHSEAGSTFTYTYTGPKAPSDAQCISQTDSDGQQRTNDPITLTLHTPDTQARNWELHASSIWAAAVFLADHIDELGLGQFMRTPMSSEHVAKSDRTFKVLELGAGAGLPGLLIAKSLERIERDTKASGENAKEWRVTLSDYPDELLIDTLRANVRRNFLNQLDQSQKADENPKHVNVVPYAWGEDVSVFVSCQDDNSEVAGFDLIVAADTLWNAALHGPFARTIYMLLRRTPDARVHLVAGLHTGRYALSGFLRAVRSFRPPEEYVPMKARLDVFDISEREVNGETRRDWREDREGEDDAERRRWVVWIVLGWTHL